MYFNYFSYLLCTDDCDEIKVYIINLWIVKNMYLQYLLFIRHVFSAAVPVISTPSTHM